MSNIVDIPDWDPLNAPNKEHARTNTTDVMLVGTSRLGINIKKVPIVFLPGSTDLEFKIWHEDFGCPVENLICIDNHPKSLIKTGTYLDKVPQDNRFHADMDEVLIDLAPHIRIPVINMDLMCTLSVDLQNSFLRINESKVLAPRVVLGMTIENGREQSPLNSQVANLVKETGLDGGTIRCILALNPLLKGYHWRIRTAKEYNRTKKEKCACMVSCVALATKRIDPEDVPWFSDIHKDMLSHMLAESTGYGSKRSYTKTSLDEHPSKWLSQFNAMIRSSNPEFHGLGLVGLPRAIKEKLIVTEEALNYYNIHKK